MVPTGRVAHSRGAGCCWRPAADPRLRRGVGSGPRSNAEAERCRRHSAAYRHLSSAAAPTALLAPPVGRVNNAHAELESPLQTGLQPFPVTHFGGKRERLQDSTVQRTDPPWVPKSPACQGHAQKADGFGTGHMEKAIPVSSVGASGFGHRCSKRSPNLA